MNNLIDIGANLLHHRYHKDRDEIINRAIDSGVTKIILTGINLINSEKSLNRAKRHPNVLYSTSGIHPHNAKEFNSEIMEQIKKLASEKEVVAIGECGLDFDRDFSPRDIQEECFKAHLELSIELNKPLFLHEREAHKKFVEILSFYKEKLPKTVVHCFTGNVDELKKYIEMGLYIGLTGAICDERKSYLKDLIKFIPLDRLMIETDAPFMLPRNMKNKPKDRRNEPAFLVYVVKMIAECLNKSEEEIALKTTNNAKEFFSI